MSNAKYAKAALSRVNADEGITPAFDYKKLSHGLKSDFDADNWNDPLVSIVLEQAKKRGKRVELDEGVVAHTLTLKNGNSYTLEAMKRTRSVFLFVNDTTGSDVSFTELVSILKDLGVSYENV